MSQELRCPGGDIGASNSPALSAPNAASTASTCSAVVASSQDTETWSASTSQTLMPRVLASSRICAARPGTRASTVSKNVAVHHVDTRRRQARRQRARVAVHAARDPGQSVGAVIAGVHRGDHRQQAPARCRYCWWPCPGGCAAPESAAPADRPGSRRHPRTPRPADREAGGRAWYVRPGSRHVVRRIPLAHRNVGCCRRRHRHRSRRAG